MPENSVTLPAGTAFGAFVPIAFYDKHMDCIRVVTHDRSVTEHRIDGLITVLECNNRGEFDPLYVGFTIKGVRSLFAQVGLPLDGVYKLAELIDKIVRHQPGSTVGEMLKLVYQGNPNYRATADLEISFKDAA
jgi:hypothetical protein